MQDPRPLLVRDRRFREHTPQRTHPECPERVAAIDQALDTLGDLVRMLEPREATDEELLAAHGHDYLDALEDCVGRTRQLDPDTYCSPRSVQTARLAAGSLAEAALRVARGDATRAFAALRPPGHHAEHDRAMGFCLLNNVAIAARALLDQTGIERIAIVDWDVHHGNGTQHAFETERDVFFASLHQFPFYPGTGALDEQGQDDGLGATLNLPLPAGCGDAEYGLLFETVLAPVLLAFKPEIILVSAGFDAHELDPLGGMAVTTRGFGLFAERLCSIADETCGGRIVMALEGGYDLDALADSVAETVRVLAEPGRRSPGFPLSSASGIEMAENLREAHARHWPSLARRTHA